MSMMSTIAKMIGILLILFGAIFALQGARFIGGSVMTGSSFWLYAGSVIAVVGIIITAFGFRSRSKSPAS